MAVLKTERHHWWPQGLSNFWANEDGCVTRETFDGIRLDLQPRKFGFIKNGHHIKLDDKPTPFDSSYERTFDRADSAFPHLISWMSAKSPTQPSFDMPLPQRLLPLKVSDFEHQRMAECAASLIVRSPSMRHRIEQTVAQFRHGFAIPENKVPEALIGANSQAGQAMLSRSLSFRGKFAIIKSEDREFMFGDGFFSSVVSLVNPPTTATCLIPLTPNLALYYTSPLSYSSYPRAFALSVSNEEVDLINKITQIYSGNYVFYRNERPDLIEEFTRGEFLELTYHSQPWLDQLSHDMCHVRYGADSLYREGA